MLLLLILLDAHVVTPLSLCLSVPHLWLFLISSLLIIRLYRENLYPLLSPFYRRSRLALRVWARTPAALCGKLLRQRILDLLLLRFPSLLISVELLQELDVFLVRYWHDL